MRACLRRSEYTDSSRAATLAAPSPPHQHEQQALQDRERFADYTSLKRVHARLVANERIEGVARLSASVGNDDRLGAKKSFDHRVGLATKAQGPFA
jgi:hypothetical protein